MGHPGSVTGVLLVWFNQEVSQGAIGRLWNEAESSGREPRVDSTRGRRWISGTLIPKRMKQPKGSQEKTQARIRRKAGTTHGNLSVDHEL